MDALNCPEKRDDTDDESDEGSIDVTALFEDEETVKSRLQKPATTKEQDDKDDAEVDTEENEEVVKEKTYKKDKVTRNRKELKSVRRRKDFNEVSRLLLTTKVYRVIIDYLRDLEKDSEYRKPLTTWCALLRDADAKGTYANLRRGLNDCSNKLGIKPYAGQLYLYYKPSQKLVAPRDEMKKLIMDAHTGSGVFRNYRRKPGHKGEEIHNDVKKTFLLIQSLFTVGQKCFGFHKLTVFKEVIHCSGCDFKLKGMGLKNSTVKKLERWDPDFWNEQNFLSLKDAPLSMAVSGPSKSSVWYNQQGLAEENVLFMKLIGVITEIGIEVQKAVQGDPLAKERLLTKICCGEKLIHDMKSQTKQMLEQGCLSMSQFLESYLELENEYRHLGRLDLYIYDMNLLLFLFKFSNPEYLMEKINSCIQALRDGKKCNLKFYV